MVTLIIPHHAFDLFSALFVGETRCYHWRNPIPTTVACTLTSAHWHHIFQVYVGNLRHLPNTATRRAIANPKGQGLGPRGGAHAHGTPECKAAVRKIGRVGHCHAKATGGVQQFPVSARGRVPFSDCFLKC